MARGLEAIDPPQGMLIAYSSAPGTVAPDRPGDYGAYATAIAEMLRAPGTDLETAFTHIRSRTHLTTEGQQTPWHVSALGEPIELVPPQAAAASGRRRRRSGRRGRCARSVLMRPMRWRSKWTRSKATPASCRPIPAIPTRQRVWAMIRARREALAWMRAQEINTPQSYWTYLRRYPNGMYAFDAEHRLRRLGPPFAPPPGFAMMEFDDVPMALVRRAAWNTRRCIGWVRRRRAASTARRVRPISRICRRRSAAAAARQRCVRACCRRSRSPSRLVAALAPAPRRALPPGAPGRGRPGGSGSRGGNPNRAAPASVSPEPGCAPSRRDAECRDRAEHGQSFSR